jgi:NAD(P)-dependent dehydrogenase (short-subunit alcohol dehydrogenase family)
MLGLGAQAAALWGASKVDVLVNNGGISSRSPAEDTSLEVSYYVKRYIRKKRTNESCAAFPQLLTSALNDFL